MSLATEALPETRLHFCHFPAVFWTTIPNEALDLMLEVAALHAAQDGLRLNCAAIGISEAEAGGMCVGVISNIAII